MKTVVEKYVSRLIINKSEFISIIYPLKDKNDVKDILIQVKKEYPKANHYCYGYVYDLINKSNDDGEPSSTAGKPILEMILKHQLNRALIVVVRYFGGIKLGAGGLTRAYVEAANNVIKLANLYCYEKRSTYDLKIPYNQSEILKNYLLSHKIDIIDTVYDDDVRYIISAREIDEKELFGYFNGKIAIKFIAKKEILVKEEDLL